MNNKYIKWLIFGGVILVLFFWIIGSYNGLVNKDVDVQKAWSNVETQYQRRSDLIVNIVKAGNQKVRLSIFVRFS